MPFHEVRFPTGVSLGSTGGPERKTEIVSLGSGFEERNSVWANSRRRYNAGYGIKSANDIHTVLEFFEARRGRLHGFRFKDWSDWKSCAPMATPAPADQAIGTGDGATAAFQLVKKYSAASNPWTRTVQKPVGGTVRVAVNGIEKTIITHFTLNTTTGIVMFTGGNIPSVGQAITAGFEFDVPVRFDADFLSVNLEAFQAGDIPNIPLVELRL